MLKGFGRRPFGTARALDGGRRPNASQGGNRGEAGARFGWAGPMGILASATRKLAAVQAADVVGYRRLADVDEDRMLARLRALRSDLIDSTIAMHHGRLFKRDGDGALVELT